MSGGPQPWPSATAEEVAVARYGLSEPPPDGWLEDADWPVLARGCFSKGIPGLLAEAVDDGARELGPTERGEFADRLTTSFGLDVLLERELLSVADILEMHEVPFRVLKGVANAHLDYRAPELRSFRDVDLAVPELSIDLVSAALGAEGYTASSPQRRGPVDFRFEKGITFTSPRGFEIDVHRVLISGPFGECWSPQSMFERAEWFSVGGHALPALDRSGRVIHACIAATIGDPFPRLRPTRDVAQLIADPRLDDDEAIDLARSWGARALVARAIGVAIGRLDLVIERPIVAWAASYRPTPRDRSRLALFSRSRGGLGLRALGSAVEMPGARRRAAFIRYCMQNRPTSPPGVRGRP